MQLIGHWICFNKTLIGDKSVHQLYRLEMNINWTKNQKSTWVRAVALLGLIGVGLSSAFAGPIYSQDAILSDFTSTVSTYATFAGGYTPTTAILSAANYPRVIGHSANPIFVSFANPTAYPVYRLNILKNKGNGITQIAELELWADDVVVPAAALPGR